MKRLLLGTLALLALPLQAAVCDLQREDLLTRPGQGQAPTEVYVHTYINDIVDIRDAAQSFTGDVFSRIEWQDPRLAHADPSPCTVGLEEIWWPELQFLNRRTLQKIRENQPVVAADGTVSLLLRGYGEFSFNADLSDFPFDEQELTLDVVSSFTDSEIDFVYQEERIALAPEISVANFNVEISGVEEGSRYIGSTQRHHAQLLIKLRAQRLTGFYTWQQLVPLFLVVLMAWIVFWIPREHVPSRIGLAATAMLTLIAYRFAMSSVLPPIAYLTRLDLFMIGASVLVFAALATAVAVTYTADLVDEALADRINLTARIATPLMLAMITLLAFWF